MTSRNSSVQLLAFSACAMLAGCSGFQSTPPPAQPANAAAAQTASRGSQVLTVVHNFNAGQGDGSGPLGDLVNVGGTLYGTTVSGGANKQGAVYAVTGDGSERVVYSFKGGSDGANPYSGLTNLNGTLYGTTTLGGAPTCQGYAEGCGVVYSVSTSGQEKVLYTFKGGADGSHPWAPLTDVNGVLYGTTTLSGNNLCGRGCGTAFSITTDGTLKTIHTFNGNPDGGYATGAMTDVGGILYGTTEEGGGKGCYEGFGCGTVFTIATTGAEKVLYRFTGGSDGNWPLAKLVNEQGALYGAASSGTNNCGSMFSITTAGKERTLHTFPANGGGVCDVTSHLIFENGTFYGTSDSGGDTDSGTIFSMTLAGKVKLLYSFGGGTKGLYPETALIRLNGKFVGTTYYGGTGRGCGSNWCGFVYTFAP